MTLIERIEALEATISDRRQRGIVPFVPLGADEVMALLREAVAVLKVAERGEG